MERNIFMIVLIISLFIVFILKNQNKEKFTSSPSSVTFGSGYNNQSLLDDALFVNTTVYHSDDNVSAIEKCMSQCRGKTCLEMGPGATALCFE